MGILSVILAGVAAWIFGAVWYGIVGKRWIAAAGLSEETINRKDPVPYIGALLCAILVAGMTRHILATTAVETVHGGAVTGLGLGLFIAAPWLATNYLFAQRSKDLIWIDALYAAGGNAVIGAVLMMFA